MAEIQIAEKRTLSEASDLQYFSNKKQKIDYPLTPESTTSSPSSTPKDKRPLIYRCSFDSCSRLFSRPCRLTEHERSHTGERPFNCQHCQKTFSRDYHLSRHLKLSHTESKDFTCEYHGCGKAFATKQRRDVHEKSHYDKKEFTCSDYDDCSMTFRKKNTLAAHIKEIHLGIKPYICDKLDSITNLPCQLGYQTAQKLREHINRNHNDIPKFYCAICTKPTKDGENIELLAFVSFKEMQHHKNTVHIKSSQGRKQQKQQKQISLPKPRARLNQHTKSEENTANMLTGEIKAESIGELPHKIPCLQPTCTCFFIDEEACANHCNQVHGMAEIEIAEAFKEKAAEEGGEFWFSKYDELHESFENDDIIWFDRFMNRLKDSNEDRDTVIDPALVNIENDG